VPGRVHRRPGRCREESQDLGREYQEFETFIKTAPIVAAYELDRLLGMDMVPVTVERL